MATPETPDEWLQKVKVQLKYIYSVKYLETVGGVNEKRAACWAMYDQLKPSELFPSEFPNFPVVDFRSGRIDKETLKKELQQAFARPKETDDFVDTYIIANNNRMLGPVSVSLSQPNLKLPQFISCTLIELSLAGQVVWDTKDGKAKKGTTNFWEFKYSERRLIEAAQLYSSCKTRNVPQKKEELLPVMYWKDGEGDTDWVESSTCYCRTEGGSKSWVKGQPPSWATDYIKDKKIEIEVFPKEKTEEPNKHPNAVYLLLCRFKRKGTGVFTVQAYAGRAEPGVENRWLGHAGASTGVMKRYRQSKTFCAKPLNTNKKEDKNLLVDVIVSRLYAQGGRKYITEMDVETHDNIVLFVYCAYGPNAEGDNTEANTKKMEKTEGDLIRKLKLTEMEFGLNKIQPKKKENEAENAKNAEAGDKAKKEDVKKTE